MKWKDKAIEELIKRLEKIQGYSDLHSSLASTQSPRRIHLAIFNEPFLSYIFQGKKTIESRFSINRICPYNQVFEGDIVLIKQTGGPITGFFIVGKVWNYKDISINGLKEIRKEYGRAICAIDDSNFWKERKSKNYATLMEVKNINKFDPFSIEKSDRSGWSILKQTPNTESFNANV